MNIIFVTLGDLLDLGENSMYPDLLRCFRDHGHNVHVICPRERRYKLQTQKTKEHGIEVLRVKTGNITKTNIIEKGITTLLIGRQYKAAINKFFKRIKFDLLLYSTPPITIANTIRYLKTRDNAFSYLMLKDIFPQNALDIGILKKSGWKGILAQYFLHKEKQLYLISDYVGCMSQANVVYLHQNHSYLESKRIEVCPNTITPSNISGIDKILLREKFKLPQNKIIFICSGNFGKPQDVDFIITILNNNKAKSDRHFVICGSGTDFYKIRAYLSNSVNLTVMNSVKKEELNALLDSCDIGLLFLDHRFTIPNFPSRILDYMNHNMPILAATDQNTDIGATLIGGGFGWWCESRDVNEYQRILDAICSNPLEIEEKKMNSKIYLMNHYDTRVAFERIINAYSVGKNSHYNR